jgi:hypothetical protein
MTLGTVLRVELLAAFAVLVQLQRVTHFFVDAERRGAGERRQAYGYHEDGCDHRAALER